MASISESSKFLKTLKFIKVLNVKNIDNCIQNCHYEIFKSFKFDFVLSKLKHFEYKRFQSL